ncbi:hypothetical protein PUN28_012801 [Cardiocondyla obscurior]|uniref:Uncharacterized protein n=1 Tax=Cardiocondyla obscurior TaxID=286306 RepID=A0AAW2FAR8_9HYME
MIVLFHSKKCRRQTKRINSLKNARDDFFFYMSCAKSMRDRIIGSFNKAIKYTERHKMNIEMKTR